MRYRRLLACTFFTTLALSATPTLAQHSVARQWNGPLLETIGNDYADPSIQARNLFHASIALYDAWAVYGDGSEQTYLLFFSTILSTTVHSNNATLVNRRREPSSPAQGANHRGHRFP